MFTFNNNEKKSVDVSNTNNTLSTENNSEPTNEKVNQPSDDKQNIQGEKDSGESNADSKQMNNNESTSSKDIQNKQEGKNSGESNADSKQVNNNENTSSKDIQNKQEGKNSGESNADSKQVNNNENTSSKDIQNKQDEKNSGESNVDSKQVNNNENTSSKDIQNEQDGKNIEEEKKEPNQEKEENNTDVNNSSSPQNSGQTKSVEKKEKKEEENSDDNSTKNVSSGAHFVVNLGYYTCQQGVCPAQIKISQNNKFFAQGKPVVTDKENMFSVPVQPFGTCSLNPNVNAGKPCQYQNGKWLPNKLYTSNNTNIVTEDSELLCPVFGGKITNIFHGQICPVCFAHLKVSEPEESEIPLKKEDSSSEKKPEEKKIEYLGVNTISVDGEKSSKVDENKKKKNKDLSSVQEIAVRPGSSKTFTANTKDKVSSFDGVSWAIMKCDDKYNIIAGSVGIHESAGSPFTKKFDNGNYIIEGLGNKKKDEETPNILEKYKSYIKNSKIKNPPYDYNACFKIHVTHNSIASVKGPDYSTSINKIYPKDKIVYVKRRSDVKLLLETQIPYDPTYDLFQFEAYSGDTPITDYDFSFNESEKSIIFKPTNEETTYTIKVKLYEKIDGKVSDNPIDEYNVMMFCLCGMVRMECNPNNEYVRPGTSISFKLRLNHNDADNIPLEKSTWSINGIEQKKDSDKSQEKIDNVDPKADTITDTDSENLNLTADTNPKADTITDPELDDLNLTADADPKSDTITDTGSEDLNLKNKEVSSEKKSDEKILAVWDQFIYLFDKLGTYVVKATYDKLGLRDEVKGKESFTTHTVNVKKQSVVSMKIQASSDGYYYTNVAYKINVRSLYSDSNINDGKLYYIVNPSGCDIEKLKKGILYISKPGVYEISSAHKNTPPVSQTITIMNPTVESWGFFDSNDRPMNIIGHNQHVRIKGHVIAWEKADTTSKNTQNKPRNIKIGLYCNDKCVHLFDSVSLEDDGKFSVDIDSLDTEILKNKVFRKWSGALKEYSYLSFVVYDAPGTFVEGLTNYQDKEKKLTGLTMQNARLKFCDKPEITGFFADKNGDVLTDVVTYKDPVSINLRVANISENEKKDYVLRVFENVNLGIDPEVFTKEFKDVNIEDGFIKIDIPTTSGEISENTHTGEGGEPRIFYFKVIKIDDYFLIDTTKYSYPETSVAANFDVENVKEELGKDKSKQDENVINTARSYFKQLKIVKAIDEENEYTKTIKQITPAIVGDKPKKKKAKICDVCICEEADLPWGHRLTCSQRKKVIKICAQLWGEANKFTMARHLMNCMAQESDFNHAARNKTHGAGLIQFTEPAIKAVNAHIDTRMEKINKKTEYNIPLTEEETEIKNLKKLDQINISAAKDYLTGLSFEQQLDYVKMYFDRDEYKKPGINAYDLYMIIFCPIAFGKDMNYVLYSIEKDRKAKEINPDARDKYPPNNGLDGCYFNETKNKLDNGAKTGSITKANASAVIKQKEYIGEFFKEKVFDCEDMLEQEYDNVCPICNRKHVDLTSKYTSLIQQTPTDCNPTCKKMVTQNKSVKDVQGAEYPSKYEYKNFEDYHAKTEKEDDRISKGIDYCEFQLALENDNEMVFDNDENYSKAFEYLDQELDEGRAVMVGVSHTFRKNKPTDTQYYNDAVTDHYVVIMGRTCCRKRTAYIYWDVAGQTCLNKKFFFTQDENGHYHNPYAWKKANNKDKINIYRHYILTQIRRNKMK